jgi:ribonuclease HI
VLMPRHRAAGNAECLMATQAFEHGTNNIAEMWAIGLGIQLVAFDVRRSGVEFNGNIHIFSDSALSVDIIAHRAVPRTNTALCHAVRREANDVNTHNHVIMHWVAGHVGVQGNEIADRGADKAKKRASKGLGININEYEYCIRNSLFLPTRGQMEDYLYFWKPP